MNKDEYYMNRCFLLAEKARGKTKSNPMVGAVLVYKDLIIGEGYHKIYGGAHAEVNCIQSVSSLNKDKIKDSILYISLEPCTTFGKTPPCTQLILKESIKKVVIGSTDFNPLVHKKGISYLAHNGVEVLNLNWLERQKKLNSAFYINQTQTRPFFITKYAQTLNQSIGIEGEVLKITSKEVDILSHQLRSEVDAILIGKNTLINDKPSLTTRFFSGNDAAIIVLDKSPNLNNYNYLKGRPVLIFNETLDQTIDSLIFIRIPNTKDLKYIASKIYQYGFSTVLIEGGSEIITSFGRANLIDYLVKITNKTLTAQKGISSPIIDLTDFTQYQCQILFNQTIETYSKKL